MISLAIKYLFSRPRQTLLMLLGIFFGTAAYVTISGIMLGFREYLIDQLVNNNAYVHIQAREVFLEEHSLDADFFGQRGATHVFWDPPPSGRTDSGKVEKPQSWYERLKADPRVVAFSPQLTAGVIVSSGKSSASANLIGCDPLQQTKVTSIGSFMREGKFSDLALGGNRIVIGEELQQSLGVRLHQNVQVTFGSSGASPFKVVGIYKTGNKQTDAMAYSAITDVQKIKKAPNEVNEIAVKLTDYERAASIAKDWSLLSEEKIESWDQKNANIFDIFTIQDAVRLLSVGAIMLVAGFGIYNVLNMTVVQKRRDVAILRSMGYGRTDIIFLFLSQGLLLGLVGTIIGLTSGYFICRFLQTLAFSGGPMGSAGHLMVSFDPGLYLQAAGLALTATSIASILPAFSASRLTPIEVIRAGTE